MNQSVLRVLLSCFLLVTLPVQGIAAASMAACGPGHHRIDGDGSRGEAPTPANVHDHGDGVSHRHSVVQMSHSDIGHPASSDGAMLADDASHSSPKLKCSACAPCCSGAALTDAASVAIVPPPSSADFPSSTSVHPSAPPGRLDRPPRLVFA